jgi:hypothetical protein
VGGGGAGTGGGSGSAGAGGGGAGGGAGTFNLTGTFNGSPLVISSVAAGHGGPTLVFSDATDECNLQSKGLLQASKMRLSGFVPEMSGTFEVAPTKAAFYFTQYNDMCMAGSGNPAVTGTITITEFTDANVAGSLTLSWMGGSLSGTFSRPTCYASPAVWNGMCIP